MWSIANCSLSKNKPMGGNESCDCIGKRSQATVTTPAVVAERSIA